MRLVQILVSRDKRDEVLAVLEEVGVDYVLTGDASTRTSSVAVSFALPVVAVEPVLDRVRDAGIDDDAYTVVLEAETVISERYEALERRYADNAPRIAREELQARAEDLTPRFATYLLMTVLSTVVATAGLLLDSPAVIVGSMVIAPLIGPALGASVGSILDDHELFRRGVRLQAVGLGAAVASATAFALIARFGGLVSPNIDLLTISEVRGRLTPDFLSLVIALGAGVAGAWSLAAGTSTVLVGVMIAAALVPPLGVVGIGVAWGLPAVAAAAGVLVLVNVIVINATALAVLWYKGYRPLNWLQRDDARIATLKRGVLLVGVILVLSSFLGVVTYDTYRIGSYEAEVNADIEDVLDSPSYADLTLIDVQIEYADPVPPQQPERVIVTIGHPIGDDPPRIATLLEARDSMQADSALHLPGGPLVEASRAQVEVRYVELDR